MIAPIVGASSRAGRQTEIVCARSAARRRSGKSAWLNVLLRYQDRARADIEHRGCQAVAVGGRGVDQSRAVRSRRWLRVAQATSPNRSPSAAALRSWS